MIRPSPIVLFAFDRPAQTEEMLRALARNNGADESDLTIFCDGPKKSEDLEKINQVRAISRKATGFKNLRVVTRPENLGSARSIRAGVTEMLAEHETIIVLEDDLITSRYFLTYMNEALSRYATEDRIASICGYSPTVTNTPTETYFLAGAHCWGWGTWRHTWAASELDTKKLLDELVRRDLIFEFDFAGTEPCTLLLQQSAMGRQDSWALPWMASAILNNQLSLYPSLSLIKNEGLEASGLSAKSLYLFETSLANRCPVIGTAALQVDVSVLAQLRSIIIQWRSSDSRRLLLYNRLMALLPYNIERVVYSAIVRKSLRRFARQ